MVYKYDLFVSYNRSYERDGRRCETRVGSWVKRVFHPALADWWRESKRGRDPVFFDQDSVPTGSTWPNYLAHAHRASRCLVPVWAPPYFDSAWCQAEWLSMVEREKNCGIDTSTGHGLVVPVVFYDGESFPELAKNRQQLPCHNLAYLNAGEAESTELHRWIAEELVPAIDGAVARAPEWSDDFPLLDPNADDGELGPIELPGMGR